MKIFLSFFFLILFVITIWDSAIAHTPSSEDFKPSSQKDAYFSGRCNSPLVKSSTLPLWKMPAFQGVAPRHTIFISFCVVPLWDSATAYSPSGKELKLSSLEEWCFSGLINVLTLSCLGSLWFGTHPYYLLNPYVHLYYLWCISIAKGHRYPKHSILCVVYFYSDRPTLCREV